MTPPTAAPVLPQASDGPVLCSCGKPFKTSSAQQEHQKHAQVHQAGGVPKKAKKKNKGKNKNKSKPKTETDTTTAASDADVEVVPTKGFTSLRNKAMFRPYDKLAPEPLIFTIFGTVELNVVPKMHWSYLGEIVEIFSFFRVFMDLKDRDSDTVRLACYTPCRGFSLRRSLLRPGNTVIVMYAEQHAFLDGSIGIRLEDISRLKIIPMGLEKLLRLSDRVPQNFATEGSQPESERSCHACGKKATTLKSCSKCSLFWYCNKDCQTIGWNDKDHKAECAIFGDKELQSLFLMDWDKYESPVKFSHRKA